MSYLLLTYGQGHVWVQNIFLSPIKDLAKLWVQEKFGVPKIFYSKMDDNN